MSSAWGVSWGVAWGNSWGSVVSGFGGGGPRHDHGHRGSLYWKQYQDQLNPKKKKKTKKELLLEELDAALTELKGKIEDAPGPDLEAEYQRELRVSRAMVEETDMAILSMGQIEAQIETLNRANAEIDDEEAILLALH